MDEAAATPWRPHAPIPLDPESISLRVVACPHCNNGRKAEIEGDDPDDLGIGGCCEGYGVALEMTPGLEPLVLYLAANAAGSWAYSRRMAPESDEDLEFTEVYCEGIEDMLVKTLERLPPHTTGARVSTTWEGCPEQERDRKILNGEGWP